MPAAVAAIPTIAAVGKAVATTATIVGAGLSAYSSIAQGKQQAQQAKIQSKQAQYQADVARRNQQIQEEQASAQRRQGYEDMLSTRRKAAALVGSQRAAAGASGVAVDLGSFEDSAEDTMARAEFDAINAYNKQADRAYQTEVGAWNLGNQAAGYDAQSSAYNDAAGYAQAAGGLGALQAGIRGIADVGSMWSKFNEPEGMKKQQQIGSYYRDRTSTGRSLYGA